MKKCNSETKMFIKKHIQWFEPIGLFFLLVAFGWQCGQEYNTRRKTENYMYEMSNGLYYIWKGVYDNALDSEQYNGNAMFYLNYDFANKEVKSVEEIKRELERYNNKVTIYFVLRIVLYFIGSVMVIISKWPRMKNKS